MTTAPLVSIVDRASPEVRCAFCHDELRSDEFSTCPGCKTALHPECLAQLAECPTIGCRHSMYSLLPPGERGRRRPRPAFRSALANVVRRSETNRLRPVEPLDPEAGAHRPEATPLVRGLARWLVGPLAVVAAAGAFTLCYVPTFWLELLLPMDNRSLLLIPRVVRNTFFVESGVAPFLALLAFAGALCGGAIALELGAALALGAFVFIAPAALAWWMALASHSRGDDVPSGDD